MYVNVEEVCGSTTHKKNRNKNKKIKNEREDWDGVSVRQAKKELKTKQIQKIERCERNGFTPLSAKLKKIKKRKNEERKIKREK